MDDGVCLINFIFDKFRFHGITNYPVHLFVFGVFEPWSLSMLAQRYLDRTETSAECCISLAARRLPTKPLPPTIKNLRPDKNDIGIDLLYDYNINQ